MQLPDGSWWTVLLGIRPSDSAHHHIGRETFLAPVTWDAAGWPVVNNKQPITLEMSTAGLPPQQAAPARVARDEFTATRLGFDWNLLRNPPATLYSLSARPGFLRLAGTRASLDVVGTPAFVGRRQEHLRARVSARLEFTGDAVGQEAGLTVRANEANHYDLAVISAGGPRVRLFKRINGTTTATDIAVSAGAVVLTIEAFPDRYEFYVASPATTAARLVGTAAMTSPLSSETAGGFTGVYIGMYAFAGNADTMPPADFDWFEYQPN